MKTRSLLSATSIAILVSSALLAGCASTPSSAGRCDTTQAVGACEVTIKQQGARFVVCPSEMNTEAPVCMNTVVNLKRPGKKAVPTQFTLEPGRCQPMSTDVIKVEAASCQAFARKPKETQVANQ